MGRWVSVAAALAAASSLSACASIFEGTSQEISVVTNPPGAVCVFDRQGYEVGRVQSTPGTANIRKSKYDITIKCDRAGFAQAQYLNHSGTTATIAGNVAADLVLTAGLSSIVDSADGADNKYDSAVNITLIPQTGIVASTDMAPASMTPAALVTSSSESPSTWAVTRLGISGSTVKSTSTTARYMTDPHGAFISEVQTASAGDRAGLKPGDVVQTFNGLRVATFDDLNDLVAKTASGTTVTLGVWRDQKAITLGATL
jgi:hypothetical protein